MKHVRSPGWGESGGGEAESPPVSLQRVAALLWEALCIPYSMFHISHEGLPQTTGEVCVGSVCHPGGSGMMMGTRMQAESLLSTVVCPHTWSCCPWVPREVPKVHLALAANADGSCLFRGVHQLLTPCEPGQPSPWTSDYSLQMGVYKDSDDCLPLTDFFCYIVSLLFL